MTLNLQNIDDAKSNLESCNTALFRSAGDSFTHFTKRLKVNSFRHIRDLTINFEHPVTVISGTNKVGKTSLLLLLACSHEKFMKMDASSPSIGLREHAWNDVLSFTSHENVSDDYSYELEWRVGRQDRSGTGKRLASSKAWSGLGKKSSDVSRLNAKIRDREVRLVDLERILPGRSFSNSLFRKANAGASRRLTVDVEKAFAYIFDLTSVEIFEVGNHVNKSCFLIKRGGDSYSSFNAASGEESVICLLNDLINSPANALILIDEVEAGFHPSIQRKLADIIQYIAWKDKKQFVITTHSPTLLSAFPGKSRRFIERTQQGYRVIPKISHQAARSKMDAVGYPLVRLYCEDDLANFLITQALIRISATNPHFRKLVNIVESGPVDQVNNDYVRHKRNFDQYTNKVGCCAVFDGDYINDPRFSGYSANTSEFADFLYPHEAPEKFLIRAYLAGNNHQELLASLEHDDHHFLFQKMVDFSLATDVADARGQCYRAFQASAEYERHDSDLRNFLIRVVVFFSELTD